MMLYAVWYHLYNFKNVENTHGTKSCKTFVITIPAFEHSCFLVSVIYMVICVY